MLAQLPSNDCVIWTGSRDGKGYGKLMYEGKVWRAHRLVYTLRKGEIPAGLVLDHLCRVKLCVNPAHLEPVTQRINVKRGDTSNNRSPSANANKTHCKRGHEFTPENTINRSGKQGKFRVCRTCKNEYQRRKYAEKQRKSHGNG